MDRMSLHLLDSSAHQSGRRAEAGETPAPPGQAGDLGPIPEMTGTGPLGQVTLSLAPPAAGQSGDVNGPSGGENGPAHPAAPGEVAAAIRDATDQPNVIEGATGFWPTASESAQAGAEAGDGGGATVLVVPVTPAPEPGVSQPAAAESGLNGNLADNFALLGVPLAGELPIDLTGVEDWVQGLLTDVGVELPADGFDSETYAMLTGAALLGGWVAYGVYVRPRRRRLHRGAPGLDSVLAYWDDRNDAPPR